MAQERKMIKRIDIIKNIVYMEPQRYDGLTHQFLFRDISTNYRRFPNDFFETLKDHIQKFSQYHPDTMLDDPMYGQMYKEFISVYQQCVYNLHKEQQRQLRELQSSILQSQQHQTYQKKPKGNIPQQQTYQLLYQNSYTRQKNALRQEKHFSQSNKEEKIQSSRQQKKGLDMATSFKKNRFSLAQLRAYVAKYDESDEKPDKQLIQKVNEVNSWVKGQSEFQERQPLPISQKKVKEKYQFCPSQNQKSYKPKYVQKYKLVENIMPPPIFSQSSQLIQENNQEVLIRYQVISPDLKQQINSNLKILSKSNFKSVFQSLKKFIYTNQQVYHLIESIVEFSWNNQQKIPIYVQICKEFSVIPAKQFMFQIQGTPKGLRSCEMKGRSPQKNIIMLNCFQMNLRECVFYFFHQQIDHYQPDSVEHNQKNYQQFLKNKKTRLFGTTKFIAELIKSDIIKPGAITCYTTDLLHRFLQNYHVYTHIRQVIYNYYDMCLQSLMYFIQSLGQFYFYPDKIFQPSLELSEIKKSILAILKNESYRACPLFHEVHRLTGTEFIEILKIIEKHYLKPNHSEFTEEFSSMIKTLEENREIYMIRLQQLKLSEKTLPENELHQVIQIFKATCVKFEIVCQISIKTIYTSMLDSQLSIQNSVKICKQLSQINKKQFAFAGHHNKHPFKLQLLSFLQAQFIKQLDQPLEKVDHQVLRSKLLKIKEERMNNYVGFLAQLISQKIVNSKIGIICVKDLVKKIVTKLYTDFKHRPALASHHIFLFPASKLVTLMGQFQKQPFQTKDNQEILRKLTNQIKQIASLKFQPNEQFYESIYQLMTISELKSVIYTLLQITLDKFKQQLNLPNSENQKSKQTNRFVKSSLAEDQDW